MKRKVLLSVDGRQTFSDFTDKVELTTTGTLEETEDKYIVEYYEEQEQGQEAVLVCVDINKDGTYARIDKNGLAHSCLLIKNGSRSQCSYNTPYGPVQMGLFGKKIEASVTDDESVFRIWYAVDICGGHSSRNRVKISCKEIC